MNKKSILFKSSGILLGLLAMAVIAYLNLQLIYPYFWGEFNQNLQSIETSYIQMAKFWASDGLWQPMWYLGYPWHVFYTPLLPFLELVAHNTTGIGFGHAYRIITALGYILVPVSAFLFIWQLSKSKTGAFVGALVYSFAPSIISLLFTDVANDTLSAMLEPRRFTILVRWGEGPHTLALVFLPLFGLFLSRFFEGKKRWDLMLSGALLAVVALTNAIALWAAVMLLAALFLAQWAAKSSEIIGVFKQTIAMLLVFLGLVAFWYNIPFVKTFFREGGGALGNWASLFPWGFIVLTLFVIVLFLVVKKLTKKIEGGAFAIFWFLMLFAIVYAYYGSGETRLELAPQALRLNTEVDLSLGVLIGVFVSKLCTAHSGKSKKLKFPLIVIGQGLFVLLSSVLVFKALELSSALPEFAKDLESTGRKIENTSEYKITQKLEELTHNSTQRVLVPGNYAFWLNYFVDVPQIRGALYQSSVHYWPEHIYYQVVNGPDADVTLAWLKIANIGKLVYTLPESSEPYHDYKVPQTKFTKILKEISRENGDITFDVPLKNNSLAKIVEHGPIMASKKPSNAIDSEPIFSYLNHLEKYSGRQIMVEKINNSHFKLKGEIKNNEAVLVSHTYDSGWKVKEKGWKVTKDPFDFMLLQSNKPGSFEINLVYKRPPAVYVGYLITAVTIGWMALKLARGKLGTLRLKSKASQPNIEAKESAAN